MALKLETIDTNLILRAITYDVPEQAEKVFDLLDTAATIFWVPDLAITEAVYNLEGPFYGFSRETIVKSLRFFLRTPRVDADKELLEGVFELYLTHPKLSFNDCYLAEVTGRKEKTPLWTFDKALARQVETAKLVE